MGGNGVLPGKRDLTMNKTKMAWASAALALALLLPAAGVSGVYTGKWKDIEIGSTVVSVAKLSDKSFAAHWIEGGYAFSFMGENMKEKDFESLLSGYFIDVTEHVFGTDDASSIHHDMPF